VQIYSGGGHQQQNWDAHFGVEENLAIHAPEVDRPMAALLQDLEQRGLLDETLVVWGGEFGRQPVSQGEQGGRDHNPKSFTCWLAGGGVKAGNSFGETNDLGAEAVIDRRLNSFVPLKPPIHDSHADWLVRPPCFADLRLTGCKACWSSARSRSPVSEPTSLRG